MPEKFALNDAMFIPATVNSNAKVIMGPNIIPLPQFHPTPPQLDGEVLLKVGDNITTDDILPGGTDIMSFRSNIPEISKYTFCRIDTNFYHRAMQKKGGFIVGAENYGQGSSREHAALAPKYIGIKAVITKSFARIHMANLINFGILPLTFADKQDYANIDQGDIIEIETNKLTETLTLKNKTKNIEIKVNLNLSKQEKEQIEAGGKLAVIKNKQK
jgi:aconitate hydratase